MKIGIIVGRFQTGELTSAHIKLFHESANNNLTVCFLGVSEKRFTKREPLDYTTRKLMIQKYFPKVLVHPLFDCKDDNVWCANLENKIKEVISPTDQDEILLYGGRDSFLEVYNGKYKKVKIENDPNISATKKRQEISINPLDSQKFREGIIYACENNYDKVHPVVDIAIFNADKNWILLGRKKGEYNWRFPGGFVSPCDPSLEAAAYREALEECGNIELRNFKYIGSYIIDDWRYKKEKDKIMTSFFICNFIFGSANAHDDLNELKWFDLSENPVLEKEHIVLYEELKKYLGK